MTDTLLQELKGETLWLTMNRPKALNAMNKPLVGALRETFDTLKIRQDVRIVVLRANGKAFCAGLDLQSEGWGTSDSPQALLAMQRDISDIYRAMRRCPQPIISLIQGAACGGGFSLALASDIRIAATTAKMNAAYIRAGLTACDMGCSYLLPRLVGLSLASELMMTGRFIDAERALRVNLVSDVVAEEELTAAAEGYVDEMLLTSPMGLRLTKDGLNFSIDAPSLDAAMALEDRQQALVAGTVDAKEAINAFLEKRLPIWKDQ
ncbi:enoyl-CoA hydratase/isomerase family protein [Luminiphilus sp.]|nr:enoyl-CoA hydratase/isomerase family protein [Luminiphilus sp.]